MEHALPVVNDYFPVDDSQETAVNLHQMSNDDFLSERMALALSKALVRRIDDWRRKQPSIPTRAAAARRLIEAALGDPPVTHKPIARRAHRPTGQTK